MKPLNNIYFYLLLLSWFIFLVFAVSIKQNSLIMNMTYLEARKIILADGWQPVPSETPEDVMGFHALAFRARGYMEVDACSGTGKGYCSFYFQNSEGEYLRIGTMSDYGPGAEDDEIVIYSAIQNEID